MATNVDETAETRERLNDGPNWYKSRLGTTMVRGVDPPTYNPNIWQVLEPTEHEEPPDPELVAWIQARMNYHGERIEVTGEWDRSTRSAAGSMVRLLEIPPELSGILCAALIEALRRD